MNGPLERSRDEQDERNNREMEDTPYNGQSKRESTRRGETDWISGRGRGGRELGGKDNATLVTGGGMGSRLR